MKAEIPSIESLEALIAMMSDEEKALLDGELKGLHDPFMPNPGPQSEALLSEADMLLYGGQAGGGKSALEVGCMALNHQTGTIFRREATQLKGLIEFSHEVFDSFATLNKTNSIWRWTNKEGRPCSLQFAGLNQPEDWRKHAGNAKDYMGFDEAGEFTRDQIFKLQAWLRSTIPGQRCRIILGSNPPRGGDGAWLIDEFGPWIDPLHPLYGAAPGELLWTIGVGDETHWVDGPGFYDVDGEEYEALSRTFIPASLDDNPYLKDTGYRARLQSLPEPLRSQLLYGDFMSGREDDAYQVIPSEWVEAAMDRWDASGKDKPMVVIGVDVAQGGKDKTVLAPLHSNWFAELTVVPGVETPTGVEVGALVISKRRNNALIAVDCTGGWGGDTVGFLQRDNNIRCSKIVFSGGTGATTKDGNQPLFNVRAEMYWRFREALNPLSGENIALPRSATLKAQLTASRWEPRGTKILIESKEAIKKRLGISPDEADAVVMAWYKRSAGINRQVRGGAAPKVNLGRDKARQKYSGQRRI